MAELKIDHPDFYHKWKSNNYSEEVIMDELRGYGLDSLQIMERLNFYKKKRNDEKQFTGFILAGIGSFIGFLSCVFTMLDLAADLRGFMLYGLSSIALILIFIGLYLVFE